MCITLHPEKTRLLEFGRFAAADRHRRGEGRPETFNFLGFTHICGKTRQRKFTVLRQTMRQRIQAKLQALTQGLRRRLHLPVPEVGTHLRAVVRGHLTYYGVPMNTPALNAFRHAVGRLWRRMLNRRSQRAHVPWARMRRLIATWLPRVRVCHPYSLDRFGVRTRGRNRMR